jgi:PAS domain-containing protein
MRLICAWCNKEIGHVENGPLPDAAISHGICKACADNMTFQRGISLQQYIDSIPVPVFVVDDEVVVKAANAKAREVLGKDALGMQGYRGGDVFECSHARLPEGCGRTIHCSGCAIRRSVTRTFKTGESLSMVPATLSQYDPDHPSTAALWITTVKVDDTVLLRVDRME